MSVHLICTFNCCHVCILYSLSSFGPFSYQFSFVNSQSFPLACNQFLLHNLLIKNKNKKNLFIKRQEQYFITFQLPHANSLVYKKKHTQFKFSQMLQCFYTIGNLSFLFRERTCSLFITNLIDSASDTTREIYLSLVSQQSTLL